ncbi:MAG TPA: glycosyltransferase [Vicinamibacterales bacterium]|nr:glycosyltransferase [Vicinamibacterales bacterium]
MTTALRVQGKFLELDGRRFLVRGVAYGTFAPAANGQQFPPLARVDHDFALMAAAGLNTVRTYTVPSDAVLDTAARHGLRVMVGIPWAQHIAFLDDAALTRQVRQGVAAAARGVAAHPATLMVAVGNEIPPAVVRWHGHARIERFLRELYDDVKAVAPATPVTYVNFPPTEHLDVSGFDLCAFNVYLHREPDLRAYLGRLQHVAGTKPLLLAEAGADSIRQGLDGQAAITAMHVRAAFAEGAAGAVAFSWTDEWWRGGHTVDDWAFGLVDAERRPKPALAATAAAFAAAPFSVEERASWPPVSVVVCAYNASDTIRDCLTSLQALTYPRVETIVVDDGSRDDTAAIAATFAGVRVISIPNGGLSAARNVGLAHATGDIVAYTDADVRVDADWLTYLVQPLLHSAVAGSGGPNVVPADDPWVAQCVARAPGGPTHVLLDDRIAEHVPGCNMAFRREALTAIDGFNPVYLRAGDDVDVCWRLQATGLTIGFAPAALVWHHHRPTVKGYWRQQVGYGEGETWLDAHHPEKFVRGQMLWRGRIYSPLPFVRALSGRRVNTGVWGTAAFPSVYSTECHPLKFLPHSPGWMLGATALLLAGALALLMHPGEAAALVVAAGLSGWAVTVGRCVAFAAGTDLSGLPALGSHSIARSRLHYRALIAWLHLLQPNARMFGRMRGLLSPPVVAASTHVGTLPWAAPPPSVWSTAASARLQVGGIAEWSFWSEAWLAHSTVLTALAAALRASRPACRVDIDDGWHTDRDLSIGVGRWGWLHVRALVEEHAEGRCLCRVAARLEPSMNGILRAVLISAALVGASSAAIALRWPWATMAAVAAAVALFVSAAWQTTRSVAVLDRALARVTTQAGMMPLPGRPVGPRFAWRPSTVMHKGQAALVLGVVTASLVVSGFLVSRDLATRTAAVPAAHPAGPRPMTPVALARRQAPVPAPSESRKPRRGEPQRHLSGRAAQPPPAPPRVPRRTA